MCVCESVCLCFWKSVSNPAARRRSTKILSPVCSTECRTSVMWLKVVSHHCVQCSQTRHTHIQAHNTAVCLVLFLAVLLFSCLHCGTESNWKFVKKKTEKRKKRNEMSQSICVIVDTDRSRRRRFNWWSESRARVCQGGPGRESILGEPLHLWFYPVFVFKYPVRDDLCGYCDRSLIENQRQKKNEKNKTKQVALSMAKLKWACSPSLLWMCNHSDSGGVTVIRGPRLLNWETKTNLLCLSP